MSDHLKTATSTLAADLSALGHKVWTYVPESLNGPCIVIQPGDPYLSPEGATYGEHTVNWSVAMIVRIGTNERMTDELNELIGDVLTNLTTNGWGTDTVSAPYAFQYNTVNYLAATVSVSDTITFKEN